MRLLPETPILSGIIADLGRARDEARQEAADMHALLADLEALHEPDTNGDCPTCLAPAPCVTHLLLRRQIDLAQAYSVVRDHQPIDLVAAEGDGGPPVPSLAELLAVPTRGLERFFEALIGEAATERGRDISAA